MVSAVAAANPHTIVVLETGGPVTMPWVGQRERRCWKPGIRASAAREAMPAILFGDVNPSAKLPVSFPKSEADLPRAAIRSRRRVCAASQRPASTPPAPYEVNYSEGLKVGYKWYDAENKKPLFPFGFGLSYTTFAYSGLSSD